MKSDNRWLYIGGVAILAIIVIVGYTMRNRDDGDGGSAPDGSPEGDGSAGDAGAADGSVPSSDGAAPVDEGGGGEPVEVGAVPSDPAECRAYCRDLAGRGALASGATAESCISALCADDGSDEEEEATPTAEVPTLTAPQVPEMPDDCQAQCRLLEQRGELREGTTLEDCYAALCESE